MFKLFKLHMLDWVVGEATPTLSIGTAPSSVSENIQAARVVVPFRRHVQDNKPE